MELQTITPKVVIKNGHSVTTSRDVSAYFKKDHADVLKVIRKSECSNNFREGNFAAATYLDKKKHPRPMYELTKNGFVFVMMGFTGKEASRMKEEYIAAFDKMESAIREQGLFFDFDTKGKLPNSLQLTAGIYAQVKDHIEGGQKYMCNLRRLGKRCEKHIVDLSLKIIPEKPVEMENGI